MFPKRMKQKARNLQRRAHNLIKQKFRCPYCSYYGPFEDLNQATGFRRHSKCPNCGSMERHRLQKLVLDKVSQDLNFSNRRVLHFAPEPFVSEFFKTSCAGYSTADLNMENVDYQVDIRELPFDSEQYDIVFASHVLEHIKEDTQAVAEIRRVLKPGGIAILPVPIFGYNTIEYSEPNPMEFGHMRAPGLDYFDRYRESFSKVDVYSSKDFPNIHQPFVYFYGEWQNHWPPIPDFFKDIRKGLRMSDFVPICFV